MSGVLQSFRKLPLLENKLLIGNPDLVFLVVPCIYSTLETTLMQTKRHKTSPTCMQMDLSVAYRSLLNCTCEHKNIPISCWLASFVKHAQKIGGTDPVVRFFRCVGELEFMGVVKAASYRNRSAVRVALLPTSFAF
ncbi:unnamed protein product [Gongylonema pulchrum]|uniref:Uncharacterized protein n=1 Tax=Gongylonema pulchrum TaxID=637853 RepID=A0A3P6SXD4_9BILA|nr:unnamed protein product [Gongylonema pulchrum]